MSSSEFKFCKHEDVPLKVFPDVTEIEDKAYFDIHRLSFKEYCRKYPNISINESKFNIVHRHLEQEYAYHMETITSAYR